MTLEQLAAVAREEGFRLYRISEIDHGVPRTLECEESNACQDSYSVAKAFTMTAVGMLYDEGKLTPNSRVADLLRAYMPADADPRWERVTVENALTHRIGFDRPGYLDIDSDDVRSYNTTDYLSYLLRTPLGYEPGTREVYTDAGFYLLSRVVHAVSGEYLDQFLAPRLFTPLGFQEVAWSHCPQGHAMGATGLYIRSQDMAKLGELYLRRGVWQQTRLLSEEWVDLALTRGYELRPTGHGYGKGGMLGQMLFVWPEQERVLAWHGCDHGGAAGRFANRILSE